MKTENVRVVPFKKIGNRQLVVETEPQAIPRMKTIKSKCSSKKVLKIFRTAKKVEVLSAYRSTRRLV